MLRFAVLFFLMAMSLGLKAQTVIRVAVASNFSATATELFADFQKQHEIKIVSLVGSTAKHVAQIQQGLEVDVFLAADRARPQWLETNGYAVQGSRFTYAIGQLALFSLDPEYVKNMANDNLEFTSIAIANPKLAPYGFAAFEFLKSQKIVNDSGLSLNNDLKIVRGNSVSQAFQFAASGAADVALIAYSQTFNMHKGYSVLIPDSRHSAIEQQAIVIRPSEAAEAFVAYLKSPAALSIIQRSGYRRPS